MSSPRKLGWNVRFAVVPLALMQLALMQLGGLLLWAADFDPIEIDRAYKEKKDGKKIVKEHENICKDVLNGKRELADNKEVFAQFYQRYLLPLAVKSDEPRLEVTPRTSLFRAHFAGAKSVNGHDALAKLTFDEMVKYAKGNYPHPTKVQAMLILGDLNQREEVRLGANPTLPVPYVLSLNVLLTELENPDSTEGIRAACWSGLYRHTQLNAVDTKRAATERISATDLDRIEKLGLALFKETSPPVGRDEKVHAFLRRRAAVCIGWTAVARPSKPIVDALLSVLADRKDDPDVRLEAAQSLTTIDMKALGKPPSAKTVATHIAVAFADSLAKKIAAIEADKAALALRQKVEAAAQAGGGSSAFSLGAATMEEPFHHQRDVLRRWALTKVDQANFAVVGEHDFAKSKTGGFNRGLYAWQPTPEEKTLIDAVKEELRLAMLTLKEYKDDAAADKKYSADVAATPKGRQPPPPPKKGIKRADLFRDELRQLVKKAHAVVGSKEVIEEVKPEPAEDEPPGTPDEEMPDSAPADTAPGAAAPAGGAPPAADAAGEADKPADKPAADAPKAEVDPADDPAGGS